MVDCIGKMTYLDTVVDPGMFADSWGTELARYSTDDFHLGDRFQAAQGSRVWADLMDMILDKMAGSEGIELVCYSMGNFHSVDKLAGQVDLLDIPDNWGSLVDLDIHHQPDIVHLLANHKLTTEHSNAFQVHMISKLGYHDCTEKT